MSINHKLKSLYYELIIYLIPKHLLKYHELIQVDWFNLNMKPLTNNIFIDQFISNYKLTRIEII